MKNLTELLVILVLMSFSNWDYSSTTEEKKEGISFHLTIDMDAINKAGNPYLIPDDIEDILTPDLTPVFLTFIDTVSIFDPVNYTETFEVTEYKIPVSIIEN